MKSITYHDWMNHIPRDNSLFASTDCLVCGSKGPSYQYFGFVDSYVGWRLIWCESCGHGVRISRTQISLGENVLINEKEQDLFFETKPYLKLMA